MKSRYRVGVYEPSEFKAPNFDTDLLGLQYELMDFLSERGFVWFEHYSSIEVDISNAEMKVYLKCKWDEIKTHFGEFGRANGFVSVNYYKDRGAVYMKRRES